MGNGFGRSHKSLGPKILGRGTEREKLLLIASAGLALSLLVITILVLNFKTSASATQDRGQTEDNSPANVGTVTLITPERVVKAGTPLKDVKFKEVFWPRNQVPDESVRDAGELSGHFAKVDLEPGMPVQRANITTEPMSVSLPLSPGMRAVSIEVDATAGLEGHALPGTRVDVVLTYHEEGNLTSKVIVQNARVLSYGGDITPINRRSPVEKAVPVVGRTMTLEVSTEDALKIHTARQMGRISLIMRSADDISAVPVTDMPQTRVEGQDPTRTQKSNGCTRGKMKMGGKEYIIDCDGRIQEVMNTRDP